MTVNGGAIAQFRNGPASLSRKLPFRAPPPAANQLGQNRTAIERCDAVRYKCRMKAGGGHHKTKKQTAALPETSGKHDGPFKGSGA
ncbi:hypothetical protein GCM10007973_00150 [Polymorphobacter multimanifer]|nr:hypothetical protein GCM10007973_00150 [Polymorphobacter multimanifer]